MKAVVIGGHSRNIGKTSVMAALIREFAALGWTAVKITQYGHGVCSHDGHACDCAPREHPFALTEERNPRGRGDTSRYLAAGARQSLWLRVRDGQLGPALPLLMRRVSRAAWVIIESNSIMEFINPLLYIVVLDPSCADFKASAARWVGRADVLVPVEKSGAAAAPTSGAGAALLAVSVSQTPGGDDLPSGASIRDAPALSAFAGDASTLPAPIRGAATWAKLNAESICSKSSFPVHAPDFWSAALGAFLHDRFDRATHADAARTRRCSPGEEIWPH
jgi:hypothetical protein